MIILRKVYTGKLIRVDGAIFRLLPLNKFVHGVSVMIAMIV